jgi:hypothetical protein
MIRSVMATNCFENFIGIKCVSTTTPKSGLFIDDLEGINLRFAADIADSGTTSGISLLMQKIDFATQLVLDDISKYASPYFRMKSLVDELKIGEFTSTFDVPSPLNKGIRIQTRDSRMLRIRVQSVKIRMVETLLNHSIEIFDGVDVVSFPFTTDANGDAEIFVDYLSNTNEILVVMDNTAINPNKTKVKGSCNCSTSKSEFLIGNGWNGLSTSQSSFGLVVNAAAECSVDEIGCVLAQKLRFPILYRTGIEIVKEALTTDRLNSVTLLDSVKCDFLLEEFQKQYESTFKTSIDSLPSLFARMDDICITCNQSRFVYGLP